MDRTSEKLTPAFNRSFSLTTSTYQKPEKPAFSALNRSATVKKPPSETSPDFVAGKVKLLRDLFEPPKKAKSKQFNSIGSDSSPIRLPDTEDRVVIYFTSLRGVRRTFSDCHAVRSIFRAYPIYVDERDVSMDASYRKHLQTIMNSKTLTLPQVFINGRHIGGAEAVKNLNESGELRKMLQILPLRERMVFCDSCGDVRFVPCVNCSGSGKVFDEDEGRVKKCLECNENGLVRCPACLCDGDRQWRKN